MIPFTAKSNWIWLTGDQLLLYYHNEVSIAMTHYERLQFVCMN